MFTLAPRRHIPENQIFSASQLSTPTWQRHFSHNSGRSFTAATAPSQSTGSTYAYSDGNVVMYCTRGTGASLQLCTNGSSFTTVTPAGAFALPNWKIKKVGQHWLFWGYDITKFGTDPYVFGGTNPAAVASVPNWTLSITDFAQRPSDGRFIMAIDGGPDKIGYASSFNGGVTGVAVFNPNETCVALEWVQLAGVFVAVCRNLAASSSSIYTSPDGITWTQRHTVASSLANYFFEKDGAYFVTDQTRVFRSYDLITWSLIHTGSVATDEYFRIGSRFYRRRSSNTTGIDVSTDGATWSDNALVLSAPVSKAMLCAWPFAKP